MENIYVNAIIAIGITSLVLGIVIGLLKQIYIPKLVAKGKLSKDKEKYYINSTTPYEFLLVGAINLGVLQIML